LANLSRFL